MKLFSKMSISEKRERLMELVKMKANTKRRKIKKEEHSVLNQNIKRKNLFANVYKKMFRNGERKARLLNQGNECSGSKRKKRRVVLDSGGVCLENRESEKERLSISSMDGARCETVLKASKPGDIQHGSCLKTKIESGSVELSEFQFEVSSEACNHVLPYVNKLRDYWHRGHNAVIFDEQDRIRKVVFFVLSWLDNVKQPILIIAATRVLSLWEAEFLKWSKLTNVVTYKGNKDIRTALRASRLYDENGSISFQVLLSSAEVIIEDSEMLDHIKWELIVIDQCQRYSVSMHSKKLKMLVADMKLLTVTDEAVDIKDIRQRYQNILSLLDIHTDADMETNDDDTRTLKERLSPFIAFECKFNTIEVKEYWVPVHLSSMQIEQYCSILYSNLEALSSCTKNISSVHTILTNILKCCDHPYLVDSTLRNFSKRDDLNDPLGAEIEVSGKLQVLDKLLHEIKRSGLRAVVLFQSVESLGNVSIGDILDDLVHQRFGQDSYVRILAKVTRRKRTETLKMFNNVENGKFVCLFDSKACHSSIQLSRINIVILFNSDWNPSYDIRSLQKITFDPHCEALRVFRLYSSFTVEEKALIFSKNGSPLESYISQINWSTSHQLLTWGASYLFSKLQNQTDSSFIDDLVHELSFILGNTSETTGTTNHSVVSNAELRDGSYSRSILLLGETEAHTKESSSIDEYLIENGFSDFWSNLLKESDHHRPKESCSRLSRRVQKSPKNDYCLLEGVGAFDNATTKPRSKRKKRDKAKQSKWAGARAHFCGHQSSRISPTRDQGEIRRGSQLMRPRRNKVQQCQNNQSSSTSSSTPFEAEIERIQKEREQVNKLRQEKKLMLLSECKKEISEVRKKYNALVNESETFSTNEMKILEEYYALVNANNLLAEILSQNYNDTFYLENTDKESQVPRIPASTLIPPANPCSASVLTTSLSGHNVIGSGIRAPAPHLRSNPLLFSSLYNQPTSLDPFLAPLLTQSSPQTLPYLHTESNNEVYNLLDLPIQFESFYNTGGPSFPLLDSNYHTF